MFALRYRQRFLVCWSCCMLIPLLHVLNRVAVLLHVFAELLVGAPSIDAS